MKHAFAYILVLLALAFAGCGAHGPKRTPGQPRTVSETVAAQADSYASDASFAIQIRDFARASDSMAKALKVRDDFPDRWEVLAYADKKIGRTSDARDAYRKALKLWKQYYTETKNAVYGMHEVYVLIYLGRADDARGLTEALAQANPDNANVQTFFRNRGVDAMLADPDVKDRCL